MIRIVCPTLCLLLFFMACRPGKAKNVFSEPDQKQTQEIASVLFHKILQDTFLMKLRQPVFVSDTLFRFQLSKNPNSISRQDKLYWVIHDERYLDTIPFNKSDSAYLAAQEHFTKSIKLDTICSPFIVKPRHFLVDKAHKLIEKTPCCYTGGYYTCSIPVYSLDGLTAIMSVDYQGFTINSSYTIVYIFRKNAKNWEIVKQKTVAMA